MTSSFYNIAYVYLLHIHSKGYILWEDKNIKDDLILNLVFPDRNNVEYVVPIMRYWDYTDEDLESGMIKVTKTLYDPENEMIEMSRKKCYTSTVNSKEYLYPIKIYYKITIGE